MSRRTTALTVALTAALLVPTSAAADDSVTWVLEGTSDTVACSEEWYVPGAVYRVKYAFDPLAGPVDAFPPTTASYAIDAIEALVDGSTTIELFDAEIVIDDDLFIPPASDLYAIVTDLFNLTMVGPETVFATNSLPASPPDPDLFDSIFLEDDSCTVPLTDVTHTVFGGDPEPDPEADLADLAATVDSLFASSAPDVADELGRVLEELDDAQTSASADPPDWSQVLDELEKASKHVEHARDRGLPDADADALQASIVGLSADLAAAAIAEASDGIVADLSGSCFDDHDDRLADLGHALEEVAKAEDRALDDDSDDAVKAYRKAVEDAQDAISAETDPTCVDLTSELPAAPRTVMGDAAATLGARPDADAKVQGHIDDALSALESALAEDPWTLTAGKDAPAGVTPTGIDAFEAMEKAVSELQKAAGDKRATVSDAAAIQDVLDAILSSQRYVVEQLLLEARDVVADAVASLAVQPDDEGLAVLGESYDHLAEATAQTSDGDLDDAAKSYTRILIDFTGAGIVIIGDPAGIVIIGDPAG